MSPRLRRLGAGLVRLGFAVGRLAPLRPRVVLATAHSDRIGGNLTFIRDELVARRPAVNVTVLAHWANDTPASRARSIVDLVVAGWHLATARVFVVDDYYFPMDAIHPRAGSTFIQVWHACGAFKKFGYSILDRSFGMDAAAVADFPIHTNYDLCLVSAMRFAPFYAEAFQQPIERFTSSLGIPRTDLFFDPDRVAVVSAEIRRRYSIPTGRRVVLFAPTFRGDVITDARSPDQLDLGVLRQVLGDDHVLLIRDHPFVRGTRHLGGELGDFAIDVSDHRDINELMLVSDILVTDYSSAIYEFSLLGRPIVFFAPDHAEYERERGFYLDYASDLPGPIFGTTEALAAHLRAGVFDTDRVARFRDAAFDVADGRSSDRLVEQVVLPGLRL